MSGMVVRVVPVSFFDFNDVEPDGTASIFIAQHIDVSQFRYATLMVRLHQVDLPTGGTLSFMAFADGHTMDDPASLFVNITSPIGTVAFTDGGPVTGQFKTAEIDSASMGSMISIAIQCEQATPTAADCEGTYSVDLVLKD